MSLKVIFIQEMIVGIAVSYVWIRLASVHRASIVMLKQKQRSASSIDGRHFYDPAWATVFLFMKYILWQDTK